MKEDVLEQIVDDYLNFEGYFMTHNVPVRPDPAHGEFKAQQDLVPSDIDVIAIHPANGARSALWQSRASRGKADLERTTCWNSCARKTESK